MPMKTRTQKSAALLLAAFCACALLTFAFVSSASAATDTWNGSIASSFAGGSGTSASPYQIATGAQLAYLSALINENNTNSGYNASTVYYALTANIDLNSIQWTPIGYNDFYANFDGRGHVIYNLALGTPSSLYPVTSRPTGLFRQVRGGTVKNLGLENVLFYTGSGYTGALMGSLWGGVVQNCYSSGFFYSEGSPGGLIGIVSGTETPYIQNCSSSVSIDGKYSSTGLIYHSQNCVISNCFSTGDLATSDAPNVGGITDTAYWATFAWTYWNIDAVHSANGVPKANGDKVAIYNNYEGASTDGTASETAATMKSQTFVDLLNAHNEGLCTWVIVDGYNNGYPVPFSPPAITLSPASDKTFTAQAEGYGAQTAHTVTVTNTATFDATGQLYVWLSGTDMDAYSLSVSALASIPAGGSNSFTVQPVTGLSAGTYTATVNVTGEEVAGKTFDVSFTVETPSYTITADKTSLDFGTVGEGYTPAPAAQTVVITNTGNLSVDLTLPTDTNYTVSTTDSTTLAPNATASVSIRPKTGLAVGTYAPTLTFTTNHETSADVTATFTVDTPDYTVGADKTSLDFGASVEGYSPAPAAQTVTVTNNGNLPVELTLPTDANFEISTTDSTTLAPTESAAVSVRPKTGLATGTYDPTLTFSTDHSTSVSVGAAFTVEDPDYSVEANKTSLDFGTSVEGYTPAPATQTVVITNTGNLSVDLTLPTNANYDIATTDSTTLAPNAAATVSVRPKTGLSTGTYDPTLTFSTDHNTGASVGVTFTVIDAVYEITAEPTAKDFGNETIGYPPIAAETITIKNTGNKIITLTPPAGISYTVGSLSKTVLNPDDSAVFDVSPLTGLAVGSYPETITVSGSDGAQASVGLTFIVDPIIFNISGNDSYYYNSAIGLVLTSNGEFANFTGVTMDGVPVNPANYSAVEGSTIVTLYPSYLDTLSIRGHRFRILFTNGYAEMPIYIGEVEIPKTGDNGNIALYVMLVIAALSVAYTLRRRIRRQ